MLAGGVCSVVISSGAGGAASALEAAPSSGSSQASQQAREGRRFIAGSSLARRYLGSAQDSYLRSSRAMVPSRRISSSAAFRRAINSSGTDWLQAR